ncbi:aminotransferase class V-fold PLP-dependent enzyme [Tropicimonas aquimaris]|uniref:Aminotransferase class V-fold PLP-dependent enzyme n=1 Tax=Tropicimonas aquimaris TaxID=914152 RepID=A0ABW3IWL3_9RHOB
MDSPELLSNLLIDETTELRDVLRALDQTGLRIVFVTDASSRLVGAISDGDMRRGLLAGHGLDEPASAVMNKNFITLPESLPESEARAHVSDRITVIPIVDGVGRAQRFVLEKDPEFIPAAEPLLGGNEISYVVDCLSSGWISSQGAYVAAFENAFAKLTGVPVGQAITVSNGTVALQLALAALDVGPGDEVIVPDLTFAATLNAVLHVGASPVIVDVDPIQLTMDPTAVRAAITSRTRAIMPVHLYGQMSDMGKLGEIAREHGLLVIEDAAEALGSRLGSRHAGTLGDAGTFSFFANKLITTGEGGMVVFSDPEVAARARVLRDHGMDTKKRYWHLEAGFNFRLTNLQAAIGLAQLEKVDELLAAKIRLAGSYTERLADLSELIILPEVDPNNVHSFWNFVVLFRDIFAGDVADQMLRFMRARKIDSRRLFYPMHVMPPYANLRRIGDCPNSVSASRTGVAFPASPKLTEKQIDDICKTFRSGIEMLNVKRLSAIGR